MKKFNLYSIPNNSYLNLLHNLFYNNISYDLFMNKIIDFDLNELIFNKSFLEHLFEYKKINNIHFDDWTTIFNKLDFTVDFNGKNNLIILLGNLEFHQYHFVFEFLNKNNIKLPLKNQWLLENFLDDNQDIAKEYFFNLSLQKKKNKILLEYSELNNLLIINKSNKIIGKL